MIINELTKKKNINFIKRILLNWIFNNQFKAAAILFAVIMYIKRILKQPRDLTGKVVLITGAASGLGANLAKRFAKFGCTLVLWDLVKEESEASMNRVGAIRYLEKVKREIERETRKPGKILTYKVNLIDKKQINTVAEQTKRDLGNKKVDIVINNAGIVSGDYITEISDDKIESTFAVNVVSHFWILKQFLPEMLKSNDGHIVTIASAAGTAGISKMTDYCSSKFAAVGLGESLRLELKQRGKTGIKTTLVCPFYINTGMFDGVHLPNPFLPILEENYVCKNIMRAIRMEQEVLKLPALIEIVPLCKFLFSPAICDFITTVLGINNSMDYFH